MINSRNKGATGERELALYLTERGFPARRGQQFHGGSDSPDVVCPTLAEYHIEVKRTERLDLYAALAQATKDAGAAKTSVVIHRRNKHPWVAILPLDDLLKLLQKQEAASTS